MAAKFDTNRFYNVAHRWDIFNPSVRHIGCGIDRLKTEFQTSSTGKQDYLALHSLQKLQNDLQEDTTNQNLLGTFWHDTTWSTKSICPVLTQNRWSLKLKFHCPSSNLAASTALPFMSDMHLSADLLSSWMTTQLMLLTQRCAAALCRAGSALQRLLQGEQIIQDAHVHARHDPDHCCYGFVEVMQMLTLLKIQIYKLQAAAPACSSVPPTAMKGSIAQRHSYTMRP